MVPVFGLEGTWLGASLRYTPTYLTPDIGRLIKRAAIILNIDVFSCPNPHSHVIAVHKNKVAYSVHIEICPELKVAAVWVHYNDVITGTIVSQITSLTIVYSIVYSGAYQRKHIRSTSLVFARGIPRWSVNSTHKWPVTRKTFPFDDVIIYCIHCSNHNFRNV